MTFRVNNRKHVRCQICAKYPHIVRQFNPRRTPAIVSLDGTRKQSSVIDAHIKSKCHSACADADRVSFVAHESQSIATTMSNLNRRKLTRIGKLMIQIFLDGKLLNFSAYSWPARYAAEAASSAYMAENHSSHIIAENINLQYVNPHGHEELMTAIVESYQDEFVKKVNEAWAISLRIDGSIDFTHEDKIYVLAKIINLDGSPETLFIGVAEQTERKAIGLKKTVIKAISALFAEPKTFLNKISSLCTDGTNVNTGDKTSLWKLLDEMLAPSRIPLLKVWCAAHRAELV